jgi:hypothetical protein
LPSTVAQLGAKPQTRPLDDTGVAPGRCDALHLRFRPSCVSCELRGCLHFTQTPKHPNALCMTQTALGMTCCCQLTTTALRTARRPAIRFRTPMSERQPVGARSSTPQKNEAMRGLVPHRCIIAHPSRIGCTPREPDMSPKILQRSVVCASCVRKRRFCACWRAANGDESSHPRLLDLLEAAPMPTEADFIRLYHVRGLGSGLSHPLHHGLVQRRQFRKVDTYDSQASSLAGRRDITPALLQPP